MKQIELKKNLSVGVNNPDYMLQYSLERKLSSNSQIKGTQEIKRTQTRRKNKASPMMKLYG